MSTKVVHSADAAVADIGDGSSLAVGGFGLVGVPNELIQGLLRKGSKDLTIVSNNCGVDGGGLGILLEAGRISHVTASYIGTNKEFERQYLNGLIELALWWCWNSSFLHPCRRWHVCGNRPASYAL